LHDDDGAVAAAAALALLPPKSAGEEQCINQIVVTRLATPARRRGLSPFDSACATAFSPRND
jgi:hypothetical protein